MVLIIGLLTCEFLLVMLQREKGVYSKHGTSICAHDEQD